MKKGFTLIELLAVIVILAIIALIAVPTITGLIEKTKKGAADASALGYIDAVDKQRIINLMDNDSSNDIDDLIYDVPMNSYNINLKGTLPTKGWIEETKSGIDRYSMVVGEYVVSYDGVNKTVIKGTEPNPKPVNTIYRFSFDRLQNGDKLDLYNRKYTKYTKYDEDTLEPYPANETHDMEGIYTSDINDVLKFSEYNGYSLDGISENNVIFLKHTVDANGIITKSENCLKTPWGLICIVGADGIKDETNNQWNSPNFETKKGNLLNFFKWNSENNTSEYDGVTCQIYPNGVSCNISNLNVGISIYSSGEVITTDYSNAKTCEVFNDVIQTHCGID